MKNLFTKIQNLFDTRNPSEIKRQALLDALDALMKEKGWEEKKQPLQSNHVESMILFNSGIKNFESGYFEDAITNFSDLIRISPKNAQAFIYRGRAYLKLHKMPEAWRDFGHSVGVDPNCGEGYYWLGYLESYWGDTDESLRAVGKFDMALGLGYRTAEVYFRRAGIKSYHMHDHTGALEDYAKGFKLDPNCDWAYSGRSKLHLELTNPIAALADINWAIELKPETAYYRQIRAEISYQLQAFDQVISDCDFVIQKLPKASLAYYLRGQVFRERGDFKNALEDFQKVLTYGYSDLDAYSIRALIDEMQTRLSTHSSKND